MCTIEWPTQVWSSLEWKTRPRFCPVNLRLSMAIDLDLASVVNYDHEGHHNLENHSLMILEASLKICL
jgi:hypothetical protein